MQKQYKIDHGGLFQQTTSGQVRRLEYGKMRSGDMLKLQKVELTQ